jgi:MFS superfamily sulfate permease-like transporter
MELQIARDIRQDLPAGIVVLFVAVPLCPGIALASGAPPFFGLIAGIVGGHHAASDGITDRGSGATESPPRASSSYE